MTGPLGNRLSICPLRFRIAFPKIFIDLGCALFQKTLGEVILNLSGQIDLPITLETSHYLLNMSCTSHLYCVFHNDNTSKTTNMKPSIWYPSELIKLEYFFLEKT